MTNEELILRSVGEIVERLVARFSAQASDHEAKMAEHRASFGARTEADRKIIEGLRAAADEQVLSASKVAYVLRCAGETPVQAAQRVVKERDGLLTQVQDQRAEIERLRNDERKAYQDGEALRAEVADLRGIFDMVHASLGIKRGDHIGNAIAQLKAQTPKRSHPVKVGEWVKRTTRPYEDTPVGSIGQVAIVNTAMKSYRLDSGQRWSFEYCEPCDPPADHDTPAGKEAAEAAAEIKVDDVVEVVSASSCATFSTDIGRRGKVTYIGEKTIDVEGVPGYACPAGGVVSKRDVRKVPQ